MTGDRLDLDGLGPALDPVDDWHTLDDDALTAALTARGVDPTVADRLADRRTDDDYAAHLLDRYFGGHE